MSLTQYARESLLNTSALGLTYRDSRGVRQLVGRRRKARDISAARLIGVPETDTVAVERNNSSHFLKFVMSAIIVFIRSPLASTIRVVAFNFEGIAHSARSFANINSHDVLSGSRALSAAGRIVLAHANAAARKKRDPRSRVRIRALRIERRRAGVITIQSRR